MLLKNFVAAYEILREACALLGFLSGGQFVTLVSLLKVLLFMLLFKYFVFLMSQLISSHVFLYDFS